MRLTTGFWPITACCSNSSFSSLVSRVSLRLGNVFSELGQEFLILRQVECWFFVYDWLLCTLRVFKSTFSIIPLLLKVSWSVQTHPKCSTYFWNPDYYWQIYHNANVWKISFMFSMWFFHLVINWWCVLFYYDVFAK